MQRLGPTRGLASVYGYPASGLIMQGTYPSGGRWSGPLVGTVANVLEKAHKHRQHDFTQWWCEARHKFGKNQSTTL